MTNDLTQDYPSLALLAQLTKNSIEYPAPGRMGEGGKPVIRRLPIKDVMDEVNQILKDKEDRMFQYQIMPKEEPEQTDLEDHIAKLEQTEADEEDSAFIKYVPRPAE